MKSLKTLLLLAVMLLPLAVFSQDNTLRCPKGLKNTMLITYIDGNSNTYIISNGKLEFKPNPDAGKSDLKAKKVKLDADEYQRISVALNTALDTPETHIKNKMKLAVEINLKLEGSYYDCIITPKSLQISEIEKAFKEALD